MQGPLWTWRRFGAAPGSVNEDMITGTLDRTIFQDFAALLEYPRCGYTDLVTRLRRATADACPQASDHLGQFVEAISNLDGPGLEELFTRTFDFAPLCNAYISAHIFGDESFKRAQLMTGLAEAYRRAGFDTGSELPDHLAVVLRFAPQWTQNEWDDLVAYCLCPAVSKMLEALARSSNPFQFALHALLEMINAAYPLEACHA